MALDKTAIDDVTFNIEEAVEEAEAAMDRIEDCGLDDYEQETAKEYLQEGIRRLNMAYDIVDFAKD